MSRTAAALSGQHRVQALISKSKKKIEEFDFESAFKLCKKAYREDPKNVEVLEQLGNVACELDRAEDAMKYYEKLITIAPEHSHVAYFELAQLSEGAESLAFYTRGIDVIRTKIAALESSSESDTQRRALKRSLSEAFCSIAELFFTDLCDEANAEERCRESIEQAIAADGDNADAHRLQCDFFLTKRQIEDARNAINICLQKWHPRYRTGTARGASTVAMDAEGVTPDAVIETSRIDVPHAVRIGCVKSLIELSMLEQADEALLGLLSEDDECASAWYLLGTTGYLEWQKSKQQSDSTANPTSGSTLPSKDMEEFEELRKTSIRNLRKALKLTKRGDELDEDALLEISKMLNEMNSGRGSSAMETDGNESSQDEEESSAAVNEAEWETVSESNDDDSADDD